jgi:hypothetical protein
VTITFETVEDGRTLRVTDTAEREQFDLHTDRRIDPEPADTDAFTFPVDAAVEIEANELALPMYQAVTFFRDGDAVRRVDTPETDADWLDPATYEVDFSPPAAKTYVKVADAAARVSLDGNRTAVELDHATRVLVGVRSHHERPVETVTTTTDPREVMAAVSTFGSALKTLTPDRSWPTLRGHPPAVRLGDALDVPDAVAPPDTGVTVEVPPEYGAVFSVASLAYYLGATVEPGPEPVVTAAGTTHRLDGDSLATAAHDFLEHVLALDTAARTAGVFPFDHAQADRIDERTSLDPEHVFSLPVDERTAAYAAVPRTATADLLDWHLTADVVADPRHASVLPFLVDELAAVRSPPPAPTPAERDPVPDALDRGTTSDGTGPASVLVPDLVDTPGQVWVGDGFAVRASNPTLGSLRRGLDWPQGDGPLEVHVVYNDDRIDAPDRAAYDTHAVADTDVRVSRDLTTAELRAVLTAETEFLHFVGHVTERGMVCPDGELDVRTLPETGVGAFFLNGCRSYEQGFALLSAGAVGGIVTVDDVEDETAGAVGQEAAMLLDAGYPLYAVLDVLGRTSVDASRYTVLGDPTLALRRAVGDHPILWAYDTADLDDGSIPVTARRYPVGENTVGALESARHASIPRRIISASVSSHELSRPAFREFRSSEADVTIVDGDLRRSDDLPAERSQDP